MAEFQGNLRQNSFVIEYLKDFNATEAAKRAGYSEKTAYAKGHELLKKVEILEAIQEQVEARGIRTLITVDRVVREIYSVYLKCMEPHPILDKRGEIVGERINANGALKALELLGKHLAMFTDKVIDATNEAGERQARYADVDRERVIAALRRSA